MKRKSILALLLALLMVLTACSGGNQGNNNTPEVGTSGEKDSNDNETKELTNPLQDKRVRQALWYAIDWDAITESVWNNQVTAAKKSLIPEGHWQADGLKEYNYDPEKAKELLAEANWDTNYELQAVYYTENLLDTITAIKAYWEQVGVKMQFRLLTDNLSQQLWTPPADMKNGPSAVDWDICFAGTNALTLNEYYNRYASDAVNNSTIPYDEKIEELVANSRKAVTPEEQKKAFDDLQVYVNEEVYTLPMFYLPSWIVTSKHLDMAGNEAGNDQFSYAKNIVDWTIDRADKTMYTNTGAESALEHTATNPGLFWHQEIVFDRLLNAAPDLTPTDGQLAESYEVSEDGKTFKFKIREGVKWHDGTPFTPEDVKWTLKYYPTITGANAVMQEVLSDLDNIEIDGNEVTVTFKNVQPSALTIFSQWPILPKHLLENVDPVLFSSDLFWQNPIGTGPFKVSEVKLGEHTILERNNEYFVQGKGNIEKIYMYPSSDGGDPNLVTNAKADKIDYAFVKDANQITQLEEVEGYNIDRVDVTFTRYAFINMFPRKK